MPGRPPGLPEPLDWQKEFNTQINKIRYNIERAIANFKTWRIMHTDYRRPLTTFPETISAAVAPALLCSRLNNPPRSSHPKNPSKEERSTRRCRRADLSPENRPARFVRADCPARAQRFAHDAHQALLASAES
jgi:hypothetical protein